jgi:L-threonylcarbamoyladenylate synthase
MMPLVLPHNHPDTVAAVAMALESGQTIIFPTDTIYGIGGNPWDERALNHVRRLKERTSEQPFTLHLCHISDVERYALCTDAINKIIARLLPGPYTLLLPAKTGAPSSAVLGGKVGIRVPHHPFFTSVLTQPVFATSVNAPGAPPLNDVSEIIERFSEVDLIVTGDVGGESSAILDLTETPYRLVRGTLSDTARHILDEKE